MCKEAVEGLVVSLMTSAMTINGEAAQPSCETFFSRTPPNVRDKHSQYSRDTSAPMLIVKLDKAFVPHVRRRVMLGQFALG